MLKRIFIFVLCLALLVPCFLFSVVAEDINFKDYIESISVDGDKQIVYVSLPVGTVHFRVRCDGVVVNSTKAQSGYFWGTYQEGNADLADPVNKYEFLFDPWVDDYLQLHNMPVGTEVEISYFIDGPGMMMRYDSSQGWVYYYDSQYNLIHTAEMDSGGPDDSALDGVYFIEDEFSLEFVHEFSNVSDDVTTAYVSDAVYARTAMELEVFFTKGGKYRAGITSYTMVLKIDSLIESDEYSDLLTSINEALYDQGKKIDEVTGAVESLEDTLNDQWNSDIESNKPNTPTIPGGESVDSALNKQEEVLRNEAQAGLDEGTKIQNSALSVLAGYASSFGVLTKLFNTFANIPFISGLLVVSVALGIFGMLLNFAGDVRGAYDKKVRRDQAEERRKQAEARRSKNK